MAEWIVGRRSRPLAEVRLFCLPHAGGGASSYAMWAELLPDWVDVAPVQPPGRENRLAEPPIDRLPALVDATLEAIGDQLVPPFALFGHSFGALVAYEVARGMAGRGLPEPVVVFASAAHPPDARPAFQPFAGLRDEELRERLRALGTVPHAVLDHHELWGLVVPALRADLACLEQYEHRPGPPLTAPIVVLAGRDDPLVPVEVVNGWERLTSAPCTIRTIPGGHFFLGEQLRLVVDTIERTLRARLMV